MSVGKDSKGRQQAKFVFDYHEFHAPEVPPEGWAGDEEFIDQLKERDWEQRGSAKNDLSYHGDPEVRSIDDLMARARAFFVEESGHPEEVVQVPFDKLAALMARGGWSFVGGSFMEFEGNHNDSEITVVLERATSEP